MFKDLRNQIKDELVARFGKNKRKNTKAKRQSDVVNMLYMDEFMQNYR